MSQFPGYSKQNVEVLLKSIRSVDLSSSRWAAVIKKTFEVHKVVECCKGNPDDGDCKSLDLLVDLLDNTLYEKTKYLNKSTSLILSQDSSKRSDKNSKNRQRRSWEKQRSASSSIIKLKTDEILFESDDSVKLMSQAEKHQRNCIQTEHNSLENSENSKKKHHKRKCTKSPTMKISKGLETANNKSSSNVVLFKNYRVLSQNNSKPQTHNLCRMMALRSSSNLNHVEAETIQKLHYLKGLPTHQCLIAHPSKFRIQNKKFSCEICVRSKTKSFVTSSWTKMVTHLCAHTAGQHTQCIFCEKKKTPEMLVLHIPCHWALEDKDKPFQCPLQTCKKGFVSQISLKNHYLHHIKAMPLKKSKVPPISKPDFKIKKIIKDYILKLYLIQAIKPKIKDFSFKNVMGMNFHLYKDQMEITVQKPIELTSEDLTFSTPTFKKDPSKNIEIILKGFGMIGDLPSNHWTQAIKDTFSNHNLTGESQAGGTQRKNSSAFEYLMDLFDNTLHQKNKYLNDATRRCENSTHKEKRRTFKDDSFKQDRRKTGLKKRRCHKLSKRIKSCRPQIRLSKKLSEQKSNLQAQMKKPKIPSKDKEEAKTMEEKSSKSCARTQLIILDSWDKNLASTPTPILSQCLAQNSAKPQKSVELNDFSDGSVISVNNVKSFKYTEGIKKNAIKEFRLKLENKIKRARAKLFRQRKLKQIPCSLGKSRLALKNSLRKCPCCGETFSTKSLLLRHVTTYWSKNDPTKPYHCPFPKCITS